MLKHNITLPWLERYLASPRKGLRFPPALEAAFESMRTEMRIREAQTITMRSVIFYNFYLPLDFLLLPHSAWLAAMLHFGIVTPFILISGMIFMRGPGFLVREGLGAIIPVLMAAKIMFIFHVNLGLPGQAPAAEQYQYLALMALFYANVNPLDYRFSIGATVAVAVIYLGTLFHDATPIAVRVIAVALLASSSYISLVMKWRVANDARAAFLRRIHDELLRDEAANEASRDALTGLSNRRHLDERIAELWRLTLRPDAQIAVLMIDVDHFKGYNDRYGHPAGDRCLKRVAGAIASVLRDADDLAVRFGGEEFLLLLPETGLTVASQIAERVRGAIEALAIPHEASSAGPVVTASVGVMAGSAAEYTVESLLAEADAALYQAKRNGRNQVWPPMAAAPPRVTGSLERQVGVG
jgi:diguanylate cyclase (GGDEF)-like protein